MEVKIINIPKEYMELPTDYYLADILREKYMELVIKNKISQKLYEPFIRFKESENDNNRITVTVSIRLRTNVG